MASRMLKPFFRLFPTGIESSLWTVYGEVRTAILDRRGRRKARRHRSAGGLLLHLGSGSKGKAGWINVDLRRDADITLDLRKPFPFSDGSCRYVYSEHFLEHLDYPDDATRFVKECFRVLEPGGTLDVVVPDTALVLRSYLEGPSEEVRAAQAQFNPEWCTTPMEHVNYSFRQLNEHRFSYDFETLALLLKRNGFDNVQQRGFNADRDSNERRVGSLYVICRKPDGRQR